MTNDATSASEGPLLEVGKVVKAHGLRGELLVRLFSDRPERTAVGVRFETDRGPLIVTASRKHQEMYIMSCEGIADRNASELYRGVVLRAVALEDAGALFVHDLIGSTVVESNGTERGTVRSVLANPASDLLELESGALVPLNFVVGEPTDGVITVDVPDGLFELYES